MIGVLPSYNNDEVTHGCVRPKFKTMMSLVWWVDGRKDEGKAKGELIRNCEVAMPSVVKCGERERERERERVQKKFKNQKENILRK